MSVPSSPYKKRLGSGTVACMSFIRSVCQSFAEHVLSPCVPGTGRGILDPDKNSTKALSPRTHGDLGQ